MAVRAVLVDRDGTLIFDEHYLADPKRVRLIPGCAEALARLQDAGFELIMISNQSGIARGLLTIDDVEAANTRVRDDLKSAGVELLEGYYCPHGPTDGCQCRKPRAGMIHRARTDNDLDLSSSFVVGDKDSDVLAGKAAGCRTILLRTEGANPEPADGAAADFVARSWYDVAAFILE